MDNGNMELEKLEQVCREVVSMVLLTCESEILKRDDEVKALPYAAMAVRESILTFLALVNPE